MISKFFSKKFWVSSCWACAKKIYFGQPCAKVYLNPMPKSTLPPVKNFGLGFWLPCPSFSIMFFINQHTVDSFWIPKNDIFCTSINCTYNTVCPLWSKLCNYKYTQSDLPSAEAGKYRGRIHGRNPAKSLWVFLLVIHSHLYSFAWDFYFFKSRNLL